MSQDMYVHKEMHRDHFKKIAGAIQNSKLGGCRGQLLNLELWYLEGGRQREATGGHGRPRAATDGHGRPRAATGGHKGQFPRSDFGPVLQI